MALKASPLQLNRFEIPSRPQLEAEDRVQYWLEPSGLDGEDSKSFEMFVDDDGVWDPIEHTESTMTLDQVIEKLDITKFDAWQAIAHALREPKVFKLDYDLRDFDILPSGKFVGLADVMLTYRGDFLGSIEESLTLPAALSGTMSKTGPIITDVQIAL